MKSKQHRVKPLFTDLPIRLDEAGCERSISAKKQLHLVNRFASAFFDYSLERAPIASESAGYMGMRDRVVIGQSEFPFIFESSRYIAVGCQDEKEANRVLVWRLWIHVFWCPPCGL